MIKIEIFCGDNLAITVRPQQLDGQNHILPCTAYRNNTPCKFTVSGRSSSDYKAERTGNGCPVLKAITHQRCSF